MRKCSELGFPSNIFANVEWFNSGSKIQPPFFVQDTIHIATKLSNIFLKNKSYPNKLPFGRNYFIQVKHLEFLLNPMDRQNFSSVERIFDKKVIDLLTANVPESEGTIMFLRIVRHIIESYKDINLSPLERIGKIWFATFILRIWRRFIESEKSFTLGENFLSHNAYSCIELNAHAMIFIVLYLKNNGVASKLFLPELLDSQPC